MKGYNLVLTRIIDLMDNPLARQTLVDELLLITNPKDKILRFIGGNEGTNLGYRADVSYFFIQFCKDAKVNEVYLRVEIDDFHAGLNYYLDITNSSIKVNEVDFGNEDYYQVRPTTNTEILLWRLPFIRKNKAIDNAIEYSNLFLKFVKYFQDNGIDIRNKVVWQTTYDVDAISFNWHNELRKRLWTLGYKKCSIHIYGDLTNGYFEDTEYMIKKNFKDLVITVGEAHGLGFHKLDEELKAKLRNSEDHLSKEKSLDKLTQNIGAVLVTKHTLFDWFRAENNRPNYYAHLWIDRVTGKIVNRIKF